MKILIVDDDPISRKVLRSILATQGHCDLASDGEDAYSCVTQAIEEGESYDLVTLDINMPDMDGQEVLARIRSFEESRGIRGLDQVKIIMATGLEDSRNIMKAFNTGCEGYIVKPFDQEKILEKVRELFEKP